MQLVQIDFLKKKNISITSFIRNTSCSSGWLRFVVQIIFGTLIVTSFILIVLLAFESSYRSSRPTSRCAITNCRVICHEAPFYGEYEDDIISTASEVDPNCDSIALQLIRPTFENSKIPENWLSRIRSNVRELAIIGGNTKYIPSYAFMAPLSNNLKTLILEKIEINLWDNDMLIGLSGLKNLYIKDCLLIDIRKNALRIVDDSLEFLDIKACNNFNPINFTGSTELNALTVVDFSSNNFNNILEYASFSKLKFCRILFLNSCNIRTLGPGTFDHLSSIEMLYLNDNELINVPVGLFEKMLPREPRIALQENNWHCNCSDNDLRTVFKKGILIIDPICQYPDAVNGMTFSDFEGYCDKVFDADLEISEPKEISYDPCETRSKTIYVNGACYERNSNTSTEVNVISTGQQKCYLNRRNYDDLKYIFVEKENEETTSAWIKPVFSIQSNPYSMIELKSSAQPGLGLLWYQSLCLKEVFCFNTIPDVLKVFNVDSGARYTFCPFNLTNNTILSHRCLSYIFVNTTFVQTSSSHELILYFCISIGCLLGGALFVYVLIHRNPALLKGNKRVIIVKHKSIEALILPPQLPIRNKLNDTKIVKNHMIEKQKNFLLSDDLHNLSPNHFIRSISKRSSDSNDGSYISAVQPTEEQLNEWRSNQMVKQFDDRHTTIDTSPFSSFCNQESLPYYSIHSSERIYEVPKQY